MRKSFLDSMPQSLMQSLRHDLLLSIVSEIGQTAESARIVNGGDRADRDILTALLNDLSKVVTGRPDEAESVMRLVHGDDTCDQAKRHARQIADRLGI